MTPHQRRRVPHLERVERALRADPGLSPDTLVRAWGCTPAEARELRRKVLGR